MNKSELASAISKQTNLTKADVERVIASLIDVTTGTLKSGGELNLVGFLSAKVSRRKATKGRNPRTGEPIDIPAKNIVKIKAGKSLSDAVN
ncbi:MAG: DNA-binding protein HU [Micavibrio sp.]|nr:DNA-binding protein HU [Micavibrio sp.]